MKSFIKSSWLGNIIFSMNWEFSEIYYCPLSCLCFLSIYTFLIVLFFLLVFSFISCVFLFIFITLFMSLSSAPSIEYFVSNKSSDWNIQLSPITPSLKLITDDFTPISNLCLEVNIFFGHFFQVIWWIVSFGFCVVPSKHGHNKLLSQKSKIIATSRYLITFGKLTNDLQSSLPPCCQYLHQLLDSLGQNECLTWLSGISVQIYDVARTDFSCYARLFLFHCYVNKISFFIVFQQLCHNNSAFYL